MSLLDYGFNTVKLNVLRKKGEVVKKIKMDKANKEIVSIILKDNLSTVEKGKYSYKIDIDKIKLPINEGSKVGKIKVLENGKTITAGDLVVSETITPLSYLELLKKGIIDLISGNL